MMLTSCYDGRDDGREMIPSSPYMLFIPRESLFVALYGLGNRCHDKLSVDIISSKMTKELGGPDL